MRHPDELLHPTLTLPLEMAAPALTIQEASEIAAAVILIESASPYLDKCSYSSRSLLILSRDMMVGVGGWSLFTLHSQGPSKPFA